MDFRKAVFKVVSNIPEGLVTTYGYIAHALNSRAYRAVGRILHTNKDPVNIPCHRVVFSDGRVTEGYVFGGKDVQTNILLSEGVIFKSLGVVDLSKCLWIPTLEGSPIDRV